MITTVRRLDRQTLFLSNNPTRDPKMYADKLGRLGLPTPESHIVNPVVTMTSWLKREHPGRAGVRHRREAAAPGDIAAPGSDMTERPDEIDIVIASYDRTFDLPETADRASMRSGSTSGPV
jgi:ribonucleotide monophosphatase NagD (HAD superfamily)